jgi:hypothetical protein
MVGEAQKLHGARSGLCGLCSDGVPPVHFFQAEHRGTLKKRPSLHLHKVPTRSNKLST